MPQSLQVLPEDLLRAGNQLTERYHTATEQAKNALSELGSTARIPAGADQVSRTAAQAFDQTVRSFQEPTAQSLQILAQAAATLTPIAQGYTATDVESGATVQQAATSILGPLIQLASTLPQQIAQAASATGEGGDAAALASDRDGDEAALATDRDGGSEVSAQDAPIV